MTLLQALRHANQALLVTYGNDPDQESDDAAAITRLTALINLMMEK